MYDQGMVRQHVSTAQLTVGSASSVALLSLGKSAIPVLALPPPNGTVQTVNWDPFAASLSIPPPSYVQMVEMEKTPGATTMVAVCYRGDARSNHFGQDWWDRLLCTRSSCDALRHATSQWDGTVDRVCRFWEEGRVNPGRFFLGRIFGW